MVSSEVFVSLSIFGQACGAVYLLRTYFQHDCGLAWVNFSPSVEQNSYPDNLQASLDMKGQGLGGR